VQADRGNDSPAPVSAIPSDFPDNQIVLGGHIANELTRDYLARYCPGFRPCGSLREGPEDTVWYECAHRVFKDTPEAAWSFLIKLVRDVTGQQRTVVLLFGRSSFGTTEAAHILRARPSLLRVDGNNSFVLAARTSRSQGYHSPPDSDIVNLTAPALSEF
jgi:hypothetical protein